MNYIILFMILITPSCNSGRSYTYLADPIYDTFKSEMKGKRGYWVTATGGSMPSSNVKLFSLSFVGTQSVNIQEARRLYIELIEEFLKHVNSDKNIRPYLNNYPANVMNTELFLGFEGRPFFFSDNNYIDFVHCVDGIIYYEIMSSNTFQYEIFFKEPYEEALRIVESESVENKY